MEAKNQTVTQQDQEEKKISDSTNTNQNGTLEHKEDPAEIEAKLIPHSYFVNRLNASMELHINDIFNERSVQSITKDTNIITSAIKQCKNLELLTGDRVRIKINVDRKSILVKGIPATSQAEFLEFAKKLAEKDEKTKDFESSYDQRTECVSLTFQDKESAVKMFGELMNPDTKFQEKAIDCMLKDGNPYLELLEASRGAKGGYTPYPSYYPQQMLNYQQMYNPMAMYPYYNNMYQDYNWNQGYRGGQSGGGYQNYRSDTPKDEANKEKEDQDVNEETEERFERFERGGRGGRGRRGGRGGRYSGHREYGSKSNQKGATFDPTEYPPLS